MESPMTTAPGCLATKKNLYFSQKTQIQTSYFGSPIHNHKPPQHRSFRNALLEVEFDFPFSYFDEDNKCFTTLNQTQSVQLLQVLRLHFSEVLSIMPVAPFLIIECDKAVPDPATTPFLVAGLIACFMIQGSPYPFGIEFIGRDGGA